jgi:hypothetical protein
MGNLRAEFPVSISSYGAPENFHAYTGHIEEIKIIRSECLPLMRRLIQSAKQEWQASASRSWIVPPTSSFRGYCGTTPISNHACPYPLSVPGTPLIAASDSQPIPPLRPIRQVLAQNFQSAATGVPTASDPSSGSLPIPSRFQLYVTEQPIPESIGKIASYHRSRPPSSGFSFFSSSRSAPSESTSDQLSQLGYISFVGLRTIDEPLRSENQELRSWIGDTAQRLGALRRMEDFTHFFRGFGGFSAEAFVQNLSSSTIASILARREEAYASLVSERAIQETGPHQTQNRYRTFSSYYRRATSQLSQLSQVQPTPRLLETTAAWWNYRSLDIYLQCHSSEDSRSENSSPFIVDQSDLQACRRDLLQISAYQINSSDFRVQTDPLQSPAFQTFLLLSSRTERAHVWTTFLQSLSDAGRAFEWSAASWMALNQELAQLTYELSHGQVLTWLGAVAMSAEDRAFLVAEKATIQRFFQRLTRTFQFDAGRTGPPSSSGRLTSVLWVLMADAHSTFLELANPFDDPRVASYFAGLFRVDAIHQLEQNFPQNEVSGVHYILLALQERLLRVLPNQEAEFCRVWRQVLQGGPIGLMLYVPALPKPIQNTCAGSLHQLGRQSQLVSYERQQDFQSILLNPEQACTRQVADACFFSAMESTAPIEQIGPFLTRAIRTSPVDNTLLLPAIRSYLRRFQAQTPERLQLLQGQVQEIYASLLHLAYREVIENFLVGRLPEGCAYTMRRISSRVPEVPWSQWRRTMTAILNDFPGARSCERYFLSQSGYQAFRLHHRVADSSRDTLIPVLPTLQEFLQAVAPSLSAFPDALRQGQRQLARQSSRLLHALPQSRHLLNQLQSPDGAFPHASLNSLREVVDEELTGLVGLLTCLRQGFTETELRNCALAPNPLSAPHQQLTNPLPLE